MEYKISTKISKAKKLGALFLHIFINQVFADADSRQNNDNGNYFVSVYEDVKPLHKKDSISFNYNNPNALKGGVFRMFCRSFDSIDSFDDMVSSLQEATFFLHATLLKEGGDEIGVSYCNIAKSVQVDKKNNTVTFVIRDNAKFSDETNITANDVLESYKYIIKQSYRFKSYYKDVKNVKLIDNKTIVFYLSSSNNKELPVILGQLPVFSSIAIKNKFKFSDFSKMPVSGAYRVKNVKYGNELTLERIKNWWGENIFVNKGVYNFDVIKFIVYQNQNTALQAFLAGDLDVRLEGSAYIWKDGYTTDKVKKGEIIKELLPDGMQQATMGFALNLRKDKFKDIRVRKALNLIFDFNKINKNLFDGEYFRRDSYFGKYELSHADNLGVYETKLLKQLNIDNSIIEKSFKNNFYKDEKEYKNTISEILNLFEQAGWSVKNQKLVNKNNEQFIIEVFYCEASADRFLIPVQEQYKKFGIKLVLKKTDAVVYRKLLNSFDYDVIHIIIGQSHLIGNEQYSYFSSVSANAKGSLNYCGIKNEQIDFVIDKIVNAQSLVQMQEYTKVLDRLLCYNYYMILGWNYDKLRIAHYNYIKIPNNCAKYIPIYATCYANWWYNNKQN